MIPSTLEAVASPASATDTETPRLQPAPGAVRRLNLASLRLTPQRRAVLRALDDNFQRFLDVETLHRSTRCWEVPVNLASVYRILVEMEKARIVQVVKLGARLLYRKVPDDEVAQPHFVCTRCGLAEPLGNDALMSQLFEGAGRHGFRLSPRIALVGLCAACSSKHANRL